MNWVGERVFLGELEMFSSLPGGGFVSNHFVMSFCIVYLCFWHFSDDYDNCLAIEKVGHRNMIKQVILFLSF